MTAPPAAKGLVDARLELPRHLRHPGVEHPCRPTRLSPGGGGGGGGGGGLAGVAGAGWRGPGGGVRPSASVEMMRLRLSGWRIPRGSRWAISLAAP
jgi:hypothetical protein